MSEAENQATSVLLPKSSIIVFSNDAETLEAAKNVATDWRFARVKIQTFQGNVQTAAQHFREQSAPDLIILQTENIDDGFTQQLEGLAQYCDENTAAIVIGPVNDVNLYRRLIDMGVSDYLVKPVPSADLANVIAKSLIERIGVTDSRLVAFIGAKGGVGTSALLQAMAGGISDILGERLIILDAGGGWSTHNVGLGYEPSTTLAEAARASSSNDEDSLNRMISPVSEKLNILASGGDVMLDHTISAEQMEALIDKLMAKHPLLLVDLSQAPPELARAVVGRATQVHLVSTPLLTSLRLSRSLLQEIKEIRGGDGSGVKLIINMQSLAGAEEMTKADIEQAMEHKVSAVIPFLPKIFIASENNSKRLVQDKDGEGLVKAQLLPLLSNILQIQDADNCPPEEKQGKLSSFLKRMTK